MDGLIEAHENAVRDYYTKNQENFKNAKTEDERSKINDAEPKPDETIDKLWALLEKNPNDKEANLSALDWLLRNYGFDEKGQKGRARVLDLLIKDHAADVKYDPENPKIVHILDNLIYVYSAKTEEFLRDLLAKNHAKDIQARAYLALGAHLMNVAVAFQKLLFDPEEGKRLESFLGKEDFTKLKDADADKLAKEAETALEEANAKYGDLVLYRDPRVMKDITIADKTAGPLFELRNLAVGKTAPDVVGNDLDGKPFKLSDYRGKVVVLDFWGNW